MYNIAVCDDEEILRKQLLDMLKTPEIEGSCTITDFASGDALLKANEKQPFDVVFLDIEMPGTNGMETAEKLKAKNPDILIIFISVHHNFVSQAFRIPAFQYLYKPVKFADVKQELDLAMEKLRTVRALYTTPDGARTFPVKDISYLEVNDHFLIIVAGEPYSCRGQLGKEFARLEMHQFIRCHESFLVNPLHIHEICKMEIILRSNIRVPISKRRRPFVIQDYKAFLKRNAV